MDEYKIDMRYRQMFYKKNPIFIKYIRDFLNVDNGMRCRALLLESKKSDGSIKGDIKIKGKDISTYFSYKDGTQKEYKYPLTNKIDGYCLNAITIYFFKCIFNNNVTRSNSIDDITDNIIGVTSVFDIDAPEENGKKIDILSDRKYTDKIIKGIERIDKELKLLGIGYKIQFSGNGYYIILDDYYDDYNSLITYCDKFIRLSYDMSQLTGMDIDAWNLNYYRFFKVPYSFHRDYNRISIPLPYDFSHEYVVKYSNPDNYVKGKMII